MGFLDNVKEHMAKTPGGEHLTYKNAAGVASMLFILYQKDRNTISTRGGGGVSIL